MQNLNSPILQIKSYLNKTFFLPIESLNPDYSFGKLGLNSLEINEVVVQLEYQNHVNIPDIDLVKVRTIADLANLVSSQQVIYS